MGVGVRDRDRVTNGHVKVHGRCHWGISRQRLRHELLEEVHVFDIAAAQFVRNGASWGHDERRGAAREEAHEKHFATVGDK